MAKQWGNGMAMPEQRALVLNAAHPLIEYLKTADTDSDMTEMVCNQVLDLAEMSRQTLDPERMVAFLSRSNKLLTILCDAEKK